MESIFEKKWIVVLTAIFCSVLWGSAFPVLKVSYEELQMAPDDTIAKIVFAGMRFLLAGVIILIGMFISDRSKLLVTKRQAVFLFLFGILQTGLQYFFFTMDLRKFQECKELSCNPVELFLLSYWPTFSIKMIELIAKKSLDW